MQVLTINAGSSSLKVSLWAPDTGRCLLSWRAQDIGGKGVLATAGENTPPAREEVPLPDHGAALGHFIQRHGRVIEFERVGHRVVHGGANFIDPVWLDGHTVARLARLSPLSPLHQPVQVALIRQCLRQWPGVAQAAVFDTAFHAPLPPVAREYALPKAWRDLGVRRYGFHGLACEDILLQLGAARAARLIICHLGGGASVTAVRDGRSIDTSMGLTPLEGLVMATRAGDVDPGALLYLQRECGVTLDELENGLNRTGGLLGLGGDRNMAHLLASDVPEARFAVALFCYRVRKAIGAHAAALGGLEQLVFSGGIGEHAAPVRAEICAPLDFLGVRLDPEANRTHRPRISAANGAVEVRVVAVDENRVLARAVAAIQSG